jgi:hypothetical protein
MKCGRKTKSIKQEHHITKGTEYREVSYSRDRNKQDRTATKGKKFFSAFMRLLGN